MRITPDRQVVGALPKASQEHGNACCGLHVLEYQTEERASQSVRV